MARWGLCLAKYDYEVEYRSESAHKVADKVFCLRTSEEKQDVADDEVPFLDTGSSLSWSAAQPDHCEALIAFLDSTEAETPAE